VRRNLGSSASIFPVLWSLERSLFFSKKIRVYKKKKLGILFSTSPRITAISFDDLSLL
jgi:hypothetical protein